VTPRPDYADQLRAADLRVTRPRLAVLEAVHAHAHADTETIFGRGARRAARRVAASGLRRARRPDRRRSGSADPAVPARSRATSRGSETIITMWSAGPAASSPTSTARPATPPASRRPTAMVLLTAFAARRGRGHLLGLCPRLLGITSFAITSVITARFTHSRKEGRRV